MTLASFTATQSACTLHILEEHSRISYSDKAWSIPELRLKHPAVHLLALPSLVVQPDAGSAPNPGHEDYAHLSHKELQGCCAT